LVRTNKGRFAIAGVAGWTGTQVAQVWICGEEGPEPLGLWSDIAGGYRWRQRNGTDTGVTAPTLPEAWAAVAIAWSGPWHVRQTRECPSCGR